MPENGNRLIEEYIYGMKRGDQESFRMLYQQMQSSVYTYALSILHNRFEAEDVMQDTFLKVRDGLDDYQNQGKGKAWIMQICRNCCLMKLRSEKYRQHEELREDYAQDSPMDGIENTLVLQTAFATLGELELQIVIMHVIAGLKHREIAALLDTPLATVLARYHRALKKLRQRLEEA